MDMKAKVRDFKAAMKRAERLAIELDDVRNATPKSPNMDGMPRSGCQTTLDLQMEIIEAATKRFELAREEALEQLSELEELIDRLPEFELKSVLYFRHIYRLKWCDVAERMHWSESTVRRLHAKAMKEMEKIE
jgi:DNA-directed RNA polymerase specialized sigma subunit